MPATQAPRSLRLTPGNQRGTSDPPNPNSMSQQYNKVIKKKRRLAYLKRRKERTKKARTVKA